MGINSDTLFLVANITSGVCVALILSLNYFTSSNMICLFQNYVFHQLQKILKSCLWIVLHTCPGTSILHSRIKLEQPELSAKNATAASANLQLSATTYGSLQSLLYEQWNRPDLMGYEILSSLQMSLDPAKLVLDVLQGSIPHIWEKGDIGLETSLMNGYILMLEQLMKVSPWIDPQVKEEATELAVEWKVKLTAGTKDSLEVLAFLQLLATYRLVSCFNQEEILELFEVVAHYKQALVLCQSLDFADKIHGQFSNIDSAYLLTLCCVWAFGCGCGC